jgi:hypothetical protein
MVPVAMQVRNGLTEAVKQDHVVRLHFTDVGKLPPPVLQFIGVTFGYSPDRILYENVRLCPRRILAHYFASFWL